MSQYKVRNWPQYNKSLQKRGSLSLWISQDSIKGWKSPKNPHFIGAPQQYSDQAILCMMALKVVYGLPYRQLVGFVTSLFSLMSVILCVPHFTTVAARARQLGQHFKKLSKRCPTDLVFDSSGFKIYGEGEWKVRQHGKQKRRRWKKFHIGVCPRTHEIIVAEVTELETADCEVGPRLMKKAPRSVKRTIGDGAYDTWDCYRTAYENGQELIVPPREGAVVSEGKEPWQQARNNAIDQIIGLGNIEKGTALWKKLVGYHARSLVETAFSRFKGIFGHNLFSKNIDNQEVELYLKAYTLNQMTQQGMPNGVWSK
jgi:Transposase DDE domain